LFKPSSQDVDLHPPTHKTEWDSEDLLKPVIADDPLLMYDIEDEACSGDEDNGCDVTVTLSKSEYDRLASRSSALENRCRGLEKQLQVTLQDMELMRSVAKDFLTIGEPVNDSPGAGEEEEDSYFSLYSHFGIHHEMLQDKVRTETYQTAICSNPELFSGKTVLDVGCGTGILSMFASRAGADKVLGVDQSSIIYQAMDIVRENKLEDKIHLLKGRIEDLQLPVDKVDVIVSEWMGYFLLFEGMLDSVLYARDKHLAPGGAVLPNKCSLHMVAINDSEKHGRLVSCWDDMYGFSMSCMKRDVIHEANVELVKSESIITEVALIKEFDLMTCSRDDVDFKSPIKLKVTKDGPITALVGFFDSFFDLDQLQHKISFSTGPSSTATHWRQTVFYLSQPAPAKVGDVLEGSLQCRRKRRDPRAIVVTIEMFGQTLSYVME
jgi:protein arginine N-methyltransferase 3